MKGGKVAETKRERGRDREELSGTERMRAREIQRKEERKSV